MKQITQPQPAINAETSAKQEKKTSDRIVRAGFEASPRPYEWFVMHTRTMALTALTAVCMNVFATNYTVSTVSDFNSKMSVLQAGDTIFLKDQTWKDAVLNFDPSRAGTSSAPIVLAARTPGKALMTGKSRLTITGKYLTVSGLRFTSGGAVGSSSVISFASGSSYCRLTQTSIESYNSTGNNNKWVALNGTRHRVDHCYFYNKTNEGTTLIVNFTESLTSTYHRIDHNYFKERTMPGTNNGEAIRVGTSTRQKARGYNIVEYNLFERQLKEPEAISNKTCDNTYRYNTFRNCDGGLTLRHGDRCLVEGNYINGKGRSESRGIRVIGQGHVVINNYLEEIQSSSAVRGPIVVITGTAGTLYEPVKSARIAFNTVVNCVGHAFRIGVDQGGSTKPEDITIANNIVYGGTGRPIYEYTAPTSKKYEGNLYYSSNSTSISGWTSSTSSLVTLSSGTYRPSSSSPAVNAAKGTYTTLNNYTMGKDMDGQGRSGTWDVGADERSTSTVTVKQPLSTSDVGPCWMSSAGCGSTAPVSCSGLTLKTIVKNATCGLSDGSITTGVSGGTSPYSYSWTKPYSCQALSVSAVTASGDDGNVPANAVDGNFATRWSSNGKGSWITLDLGGSRTVCSVDIAWYKGDGRTSNFDIQLSANGTSFTTVFSGTSSLGLNLQRQDIADATGRYMRIVFNGNSLNDWCSITEIKVNGAPAASVIGTTPSLTGLAAGTYEVRITDAKGCSVSSTVTVLCCGELPVASVSAIGDDGNVPANTLDGSLATRWSNRGVGSWIALDLGTARSLCSVDIAWYKGDVRTNNFEIQLSASGTTYSTVYSGTSSLGLSLQSYGFTAGDARYVRIVFHGNSLNDWCSITEIEVKGATEGNVPAPQVVGHRLPASAEEGAEGQAVSKGSIAAPATGLKLYPNPAGEWLTVEGIGEMGGELIISNLLGAVQHRESLTTADGTSKNLSVGHLPSGVYLIEFRTETTRIVQKFIKN